MKLRYTYLFIILGCVLLGGCNKQETKQWSDITYGANKDDVSGSVNNEQIIYTSEDIFLQSFECGYLNQNECPGDAILIIEDEEELAIAETHYRLALPKGEGAGSKVCNLSVIDVFQEMKARYSIDEYTYVVQYMESSSGMFNYNVDKLVIEGESLYFELDDTAKKGNNYDTVTCDMSGWCYLAALPKDILKGKTFTTAIHPYADSQADNLFEDFITGEIPAIRVDSQDRFYITELNMNTEEWDSFSIGEKVDLDNDGENELILDGPYGGMYLDVSNEHVIVFAEGEGTAAELSYVYYNDAYWIVTRDVTHAGRQMYQLKKYSGADCITDSFELSAEYYDQDNYDENSQFTYRGEKISMEQYEQLYNEIFVTVQ